MKWKRQEKKVKKYKKIFYNVMIYRRDLVTYSRLSCFSELELFRASRKINSLKKCSIEIESVHQVNKLVDK